MNALRIRQGGGRGPLGGTLKLALAGKSPLPTQIGCWKRGKSFSGWKSATHERRNVHRRHLFSDGKRNIVVRAWGGKEDSFLRAEGVVSKATRSLPAS